MPHKTQGFTWTIEDECGNLSIAVQVITVEDNIDPVITNCPADGIFECDNFPGLGDFTPDATDNCDPFPMVVGNETILDGFCNNWHRDQARAWAERDAVRPTGRHPDPHRIAGASVPRRMD